MISAHREPEEWRPVPGYEGYYEASDHGRVRSLPGGRRKGGVLSTKPPGGIREYTSVALYRDGIKTTHDLHTIIATTFLGTKPSPRHEVRHYDGDRSNNKITNLIWGTAKENGADRSRHGSQSGSKNGYAKLTEEDVVRIRALVERGWSHVGTAATFHVHTSTVQRIMAGKRWQHFQPNAALRTLAEEPSDA